VLTDNGFSSKENRVFIKVDMGKDFVIALKSNHTVALTPEDQRRGRYVRVDALPLEVDTVLKVQFKGGSLPRAAGQASRYQQIRVFGVLYRVTSNLLLDYDRLTTLHQKRWNVEVFHKSTKSNTGLARAPTHTVRKPSNLFFTSIYAFFQLELLKLKQQPIGWR
jgi:hypothetical protein